MQTVLTKHFQDNGVGKNGKPYTRHDFVDDLNRRFSTFDAALASKTQTLLNQPIEVVGAEAKNPAYPNSYDFTEVIAINGNGQTALVEGRPVVQVQLPESVYTPSPQTVTEPERQLRIMRQSALDRALTAFGIAGEDPLVNSAAVYEKADEYINYFVNGVVPADEAPTGPTV